jgi:hypothetical protein
VESITYLDPGEVVDGRPFTDPQHITGDLNSLRYLADQLRLLLKNPRLLGKSQPPITVYRPDLPNEWVYRIVIPDPEQLLAGDRLIFVGFLGQRRDEADRTVADEFDEILVGEIPEHAGLLSYCTMALVSGNFCNLVLFSDEGAKVRWSRSRAHDRAVRQISPDYYYSVRLYNGVLPRGISDGRDMQLTRVKYFDYQDDPWWRAVRVFEEEA